MGNHNLKSIIKEGTVENVDEYLKECPDMKNHVFRYGWTPCHLAVEYHKLDVLKYLIETAKADIKHVDNAGSNLLHHALHFADHHFDVVKYLLETGVFKFDESKDEHQNTTLHLAFKYCTLKEIAELNKYYKGLKELFQEKNDHGLTPLAILRERVKHSEESLDIVRQLQEEIEKEGDTATPAGTPSTRRSTDKKSPSGSGRSSPELKHSDGGEKAGSKRTKKGKSSDDEEKEENKKHSDEDKKKHGSKHSKHHHEKHSDDKHDDEHNKKHSDEDKKKHGSKHHKHDDEHDKKHGSKHHKHEEEHDKKHSSKHQKHDEHEVEGKKHSHKKKHSGEGSD